MNVSYSNFSNAENYHSKSAEFHTPDSLDQENISPNNQSNTNVPNSYEEEEALLPYNGIAKVTLSNGKLYEGIRKKGERVENLTISLQNGSKCCGNYINGKFDGKFTTTLPNGTVMHGTMVNGKMCGRCIQTNLDGSKKMGNILNGEWVGVITWIDTTGIAYTGTQNKNGEWTGKIKVKYPEGHTLPDGVTLPEDVTLYGEMDKNTGMMNGHVVETYSSGLKREGNCVNGELVGLITQTSSYGIMKGVQQNGCWIGVVTHTYPDGTILRGMTENQKWVGPLTRTDPDGTKYSGIFKNDDWQGNITVRYPDGDAFIGRFNKGQREGYGIERFADGSVFKGNFRNNNKDGLGTTISASGKIYTSIWRNGKDCPEEYRSYLEQEGKEGEAAFKSLSREEGKAARKARKKKGKRKNKAGSIATPDPIQPDAPAKLNAEAAIQTLWHIPAVNKTKENAEEVSRARRAIEIHNRIPLYKEGRRVRRFETKIEAKLRAFKEKNGADRYDSKMSLEQILEDRACHHFPGIRLLLADKRDCKIYADETKTGYELNIIRTRRGERVSGVLDIAINKENEEYHKYFKDRVLLDEDDNPLKQNEFPIPESEWKSDEEDAVEDDGEWEPAGDFLYSVAKTGTITIEYPNEDYKIEILPKKKKLLRRDGC